MFEIKLPRTKWEFSIGISITVQGGAVDMEDDKIIETVVWGLSADSAEVIDTAVETGRYHFCGISDSNSKTAEAVAERFGCVFFDDPRQMLLQSQADLMMCLADFYPTYEHIRFAMDNGLNILKNFRPAVDFDSSREILKYATKKGVLYSVLSPFQYSEPLSSLKNCIEETGIENIFFAALQYNLLEDKNQQQNRWLCDPELSGGGVLLRHCYDPIDLIVSMFGVPQQVYAVNYNSAPDKQQRLCTTEDAAFLTMKFSDTLTVTLVANRLFAPKRKDISIYTKNSRFELSENELMVFDTAGSLVKQFGFEDDTRDALKKFLENFAGCLNDPSENPFENTERPLKNMAVISTAYLSTKTAMPEEPGRFLDMA